MATTAEKLQVKTSSSGAAAIEMKLNDTRRLHSFLVEEMENYSDFLEHKIEKWDTIQTRIQDLSSWMDDTDEKLETLKENEDLDGHWLDDIKV